MDPSCKDTYKRAELVNGNKMSHTGFNNKYIKAITKTDILLK